MGKEKQKQTETQSTKATPATTNGVALAPPDYGIDMVDQVPAASAPVAKLGHAAQAGGLTIQRKKNKKEEPSFYQLVLDRIADEEKSVTRIVRSTIGGWHLPYLRALLRLCQAVEQEDTEAAKSALTAFLAEKTPDAATFDLITPVFDQIAIRLYLMRLETEADQMHHYETKNRVSSPYSNFQDPHRGDKRFWEGVVEKTLNKVDLSDEASTARSLDDLLYAFKGVQNAIYNIDKKALAREIEAASYPSMLDPYGISRSNPVSTYLSQLKSHIRDLYEQIQILYQSLLDNAIQELEAGNIAPFKTVQRILKTKIKPVVMSKKKDVSGVELTIVKSKFTKSGGKHLDFFLKGKQAKKRSVDFTYFDPDEAEFGVEEKEDSINYTFETRETQLKFLESLYLDKQNAGLIKQQGQMKLHSLEDWRTFLIAKFESQRQAGKSIPEAYSITLDFLKSYLSAFTISSKFNIVDQNIKYLDQSFPRALTGQLIHDCGVYALRIAFMLSLLQPKLNLKISAIRLPVHLGLIITGDGVPPVIVHNGSINVLEDDTIKKAWENWQGNKTDKDFQSAQASTQQHFLGDLAATYFIANVDMPYRLEALPANTSQSPQKLKQSYYRTYRKLTKDIFQDDKKHDIENFNLEYLTLMDQQKQLHNGEVRPFWNNIAHKAWAKYGKEILSLREDWHNTKGSKEKGRIKKSYQTVVNDYTKPILKAYNPIKLKLDDTQSEEKADGFAPSIQAQKDRVSQTLKDHPHLAADRTRRLAGFKTPWQPIWQLDLEDHLAKINDISLKLSKKDLTPGYATPKGFLGRIQ